MVDALTVTLKNNTDSPQSLNDWSLRDAANHKMTLEPITIAPGASEEVTATGSLSLNNTGDEITLLDADGNEKSKVVYTAAQVVTGQPIFF